jgi:hypothetical protein
MTSVPFLNSVTQQGIRSYTEHAYSARFTHTRKRDRRV